MKKIILLITVIIAGTFTYAKAQVSININAGFFGSRHGVYVAPPPPVVYGNVYAQPYAPVVYVAPRPRPVYYAPAPVYVERRGNYGYARYGNCARGYGRDRGWKGRR